MRYTLFNKKVEKSSVLQSVFLILRKIWTNIAHMAKNLVIVESPAKAKTIEKFLGKDFEVLSSYGHIRDLKKKDFSVDIEHNYKPI